MNWLDLFIIPMFLGTASLITSPCALPLLPIYAAYFLGASSSFKIVTKCVLSVSVLVITFSIIGALAAYTGAILLSYSSLFGLISGIIIMTLGISLLFNVRFHLLRLPAKKLERNFAGFLIFSVLYGVVFAGACSAPFFITTLLLASLSGNIIDGVLKLASYSLGIGVPLVVLGVLSWKLGKFFSEKTVERMLFLRRVSGVLLLLVGTYIVLDNIEII